ncbi:MAG: galactokinase [Sphaerochaetaceae bacterium]|nr:galactokinase [Sphaerochaetaceae bacterium]
MMFNIAGLYGKDADSGKIQERIDKIAMEHVVAFGVKAEAIFSAPGRTELGGNHTDHNLGKVLAGAINLDTLAAVHKVPGTTISFMSEGYQPITINIFDLSINPEEKGTTASLIRGIAHAIIKRGGQVGGFCANINSTVLRGSGLSSSASVEILIGTIFNTLFNNNHFTTTELAIMGQEAENIYFGKPSGLMDQIACANGGVVGIDFKNPVSPIIVPVSIDFVDYGYNLVITSTGSNHANLTDDYASIPKDMKTVAKFFGKDNLRDVDQKFFISNIAEMRRSLKNDKLILRAFHYYEENNRVDEMLKALKLGDFQTYLNIVNESGSSSFKYLQNIYSPSNPSEQGISLAYAMTESFLKGSGAFRVQGGGFAGTIEAYVPCDKTQNYFKHMESVFGQGCCTTIAIRSLPATRIS